jgi:hypothetical protein
VRSYHNVSVPLKYLFIRRLNSWKPATGCAIFPREGAQKHVKMIKRCRKGESQHDALQYRESADRDLLISARRGQTEKAVS